MMSDDLNQPLNHPLNQPLSQLPNAPSATVRQKPSWRLAGTVLVVAFLAYLPSLSHRASLWSTELTVRACGWEWRPVLQQPLWQLFQLPFHLLPLAWRPLALNLGNLLLASVVLGLLARVVQLWPQDRTPDLRGWKWERLGWLPAGGLAWLPPVGAALALALTLNFWRQATSATGDMIDLLVLAVVTLSFVEYQWEPRPRRLWVMAITYGVGMANDWAFTGMLPVFLLAIISLLGWRATLTQFAMALEPLTRRGEEESNMLPRDLGQLDLRPPWIIITGLTAGFLTVLILPVWHWLTVRDQMTLGDGLLSVWYWQKSGLASISDLISQDGLAIVLALSSLVPLWLVSVRWQDEEASYFSVSYRLTGKAFWLLHGLLAFLSAWILLGAVIGPANVLLEQSFLPHYYVCALVLGCCLNYLVRRLLGRTQAEAEWEQAQPLPPPRWRWRGWALLVLVLLAGGDLALMAARNAPVIRLVNRVLPDDYQRWVLDRLPAGPKVLVADDSNLLNLSRLLMLGRPGDRESVFLDTAAASQMDYLRQQARLLPPVWRTVFENATNGESVRPLVLDRMLEDLALNHRVFYLHPSEMHPYDHFHPQDSGMVHELWRRDTNAPAVPASLALATAGDWQEFEQSVEPQLTNAIENLGPSLKRIKTGNPFLRLVQLPPPRDFTAAYFARYYSLAADARGVAFQRAGNWAAAATLFEEALNLNPYNASARANLDYNQCRQSPTPLAEADPADEGFANYDSIEQAVKAGGPVDDPMYRLMLADSCTQAGLYNQAVAEDERVVELEPANADYRFLLGDAYLQAGRPEAALALARQFRAQLTAAGLATRYADNLTWLETRANLSLHRKTEALTALDQAINAGHGDARRMVDAVAILWRNGLQDEARDLMDLLAQQRPNSEPVLVLRGYVHLALDEPAQAEQDFARVLELNPKNELARYKHGCVLIQLRRYDDARRELQTMLQYTAYAFPAHFALAQIALAQGDHPAARQELSAYLQLAATNAPDYARARQQLQSLP